LRYEVAETMTNALVPNCVWPPSFLVRQSPIKDGALSVQLHRLSHLAEA